MLRTGEVKSKEWSNPLNVYLLVSRLIPISDLLPPHSISRSGSVVCPFHQDSTPSAQIHEDEDGIERLYCFACRKNFTSWNYLKEVNQENPFSVLTRQFTPEFLQKSMESVEVQERASDTRLEESIERYKREGNLDRLLKDIYLPEP